MKPTHRILLPALLCLLCAVLPTLAAQKPNIVLILADDLGYETLNCNGGTSYKTPNIDALAKSGMRFTGCYATPLCSPSRVELMTGRYGFRTSWINLIGRGQEEEVNDYFDPKKEITFGRVLKDAGYATAIAGKWQLCEFPKHPDTSRNAVSINRFVGPGKLMANKPRAIGRRSSGTTVSCEK
jgi:arylsulfatase A-like enzyme